MSSAQIAHFNERGFVAPISLFSPAEITGLRDYFDSLLPRYLVADGQDQYSIASAHTRHGRVWDILTNPRPVAIARDVIGEDVVAIGAHFWCKLPRDGRTVAWHQDADYWALRPARAITIWLAIDSADRDNGCMTFIPSSHLCGRLLSVEADADLSSVLPRQVSDAEMLGEPVPIELRAGEASLHSDLLLHGSGVNDSDRRRCGLALRYTASWVSPGENFRRAGVFVSGRRIGNWVDVRRPDTP